RDNNAIRCDETAVIVCAGQGRKRPVYNALGVSSKPEPVASLQLNFLDGAEFQFLAVSAHIDSVLFAIAAYQRNEVFLLTRLNRIDLTRRQPTHFALFGNKRNGQARYVTLRRTPGCTGGVIRDKCTPLNHVTAQGAVLFHFLSYIGRKG